MMYLKMDIMFEKVTQGTAIGEIVILSNWQGAGDCWCRWDLGVPVHDGYKIQQAKLKADGVFSLCEVCARIMSFSVLLSRIFSVH